MNEPEPLDQPPLQRLAQLKVELQEAVKKEAYEQASILRDRIREIERDLTRRPGARRPASKSRKPDGGGRS